MPTATMSDLAVAVAKLKAAKDIAESMASSRDAAALQEKQIEFQSRLLEANNAIFAAQEERLAMLERISELEKRVAREEAWERKKQRYELISLAPNVVAYAPKEPMQGAEAPHYLCANCFAQEKESFFQQRAHGVYVKFGCNTCKEELSYSTERLPTHYNRGPRGGGPQGWMAR